ncbi:MAG: cytidylate kinase-like family protein [Oscillospiraceae bacterium]|nr:cytidylate kinase-like family protein [Oscillospiraceae bacterium]
MIITINREFGSGGRELGKRLAGALSIPCYDDEIIEMITKEHGWDAGYVARVSERSIRTAYPLTIGRRFSVPYSVMEQSVKVAVAERKIIEGLAQQGDCVIVGRCADAILEQFNPFNIFVYADMEFKIKRCQERAAAEESITPQEMKRRIQQIDRSRALQYETFSKFRWGAKEAYHLCINTSGKEIKTLVPAVALYCKALR